MDNENLFSELELPVDVSELGELVSAELECPGVYYLAVKLKTDAIMFFKSQIGISLCQFGIIGHNDVLN